MSNPMHGDKRRWMPDQAVDFHQQNMACSGRSRLKYDNKINSTRDHAAESIRSRAKLNVWGCTRPSSPVINTPSVMWLRTVVDRANFDHGTTS
ncbi:hypothetical protein N7539_007267 [Penicillium diatomitis]|uniref:Uncharacterized protein n=1 Tax=Penicillium diatomitis TaxID=2819901 RepID=A0A9W9WUS7_9EURO|nr:uncharacterized protein N7539_007267 [Penicillium diatomitis]KAJ5477123.1 hypothetical protein N7539_007267 [Penicillium diatomitis]